MDEQRLAAIVQEVLQQLRNENQVARPSPAPTAPAAAPAAKSAPEVGGGVFATVDEAIAAAEKAQKELVTLGLEKREELVQAMREAALEAADRLAKQAYKETGLGRYEHKIGKNIDTARLTPGTEDIASRIITANKATVLIEHSPMGIAVSITPTTNPSATIINHGIGMVAAGNACFFAPHPRSQMTSLETMRVLNEAIVKAGGPENCLVAVTEAKLDAVNEAMHHPRVRLVVATGGAGLVKAALSCGKRTIAGGPGNPPALVDDTADLAHAAKAILAGAVLDNNLLCIAEKVIIVQESVATPFMRQLLQLPVVELRGSDINRLTDLVVKDGHMNPDYIGRDAAVILNDLGIRASSDVEAIVIEVDASHPLVQLEQLMPILPVVRVGSFAQGLALAVEVEHGNRHTAIIHSQNLERITAYGRAIRPTLLVCNAPSYAGLGVDGAGPITLTVAGPTGEGIVTARHFTRENRVILGQGALTVIAGD